MVCKLDLGEDGVIEYVDDGDTRCADLAKLDQDLRDMAVTEEELVAALNDPDLDTVVLPWDID